MKKSDQDLFYQSIGRQLTKARERLKLSVSQLSTRVGEQYNTIAAIESGKPFMTHQTTWMKDFLGMNLNITVTDACNENSISMTEGDDNGQESKKESSSLSDFL